MTDDLFRGLASALESDPTNDELRLHFAALLLDAGRHRNALEHAEAILEHAPDRAAALAIAAEAAEALDHPKAAAYRRLAEALRGNDAATDAASDSSTPFAPIEDSGEEAVVVPDTPEALLGIWDQDAPVEPSYGELIAPGISFADVGGMNDVKSRLDMSFLAPMRNPEIASTFSKNLRGGLLLWGPPGCGKTFLARACAGELGAKFYSVGLADVLDMYVGSSERNLASVFTTARRNAPCLLFFDELDALGQKRTNLSSSGSALRGTVNQLLTELDGVGAENDGVYVLGATNHPWDIDSALLRPGRFDRMMVVLPPDVEARAAILAFHMRGRPQEQIDVAAIARKTKRFSGADLALLCETATELAMAASMETGRVQPVTMNEFKQALRSTQATTGRWLDTAKNFAMYSNDGGSYDELLAYLKKR